jgi:hypothetical protein
MSRRFSLRPRLESLDGRWLPSTVVPGLTTAQLDQAYGFNIVPAVNGAGQTIAIIDAYHDPYLASDLATFDQAMNLPGQTAAQLTSSFQLIQVNLSGNPNNTNDGWAGEETLDAEWAHAAAPGARIIVLEAASDSLSDLMSAVNIARTIPGVSVISMSWGGSEFSGETAYDSYFTTPAGHTPITFLAASGDSGAWYGAQWPASSPNVVAVGGTTLFTTSNGTRLFEMGWSGSGGGVSAYETEPSYQYSVQTIGRRTTPDVALDADPWTGLATYTTTPSTGQGAWEQVGGTSASTQIWAGLIADADNVRADFGKGTLSTSMTLTTLYDTPGLFNQIAWGSNGYPATPGYNLVTGLGSPQVLAIDIALYQPGPLLSSAVTAAATSSQATTTTASPHDVPQTTTATTAASVTTPATPSNVQSMIIPTNVATTAAGPSTPAASATTSVTVVAPALGPNLTDTNVSTAASNAVPQPLAQAPVTGRTIPEKSLPPPPVELPNRDPEATTPGTTTPSSDPSEMGENDSGAPVGTGTGLPSYAAPAAEDHGAGAGGSPAGGSGPSEALPDTHPSEALADTCEGLASATLRLAPPIPLSGAAEPDPAARPGRASVVGMAVIALGAMAWRSWAQARSVTPHGPRAFGRRTRLRRFDRGDE